jgi:hypothetical protein
MKVRSFLLIAALLLVGVILLWPRNAQPDLGNPIPGANVMVVQPSATGSPENAFPLPTARSSGNSNNPSLHTRLTTDGLHQKPSARDIEMHRLREEWNIPPAPRAVKGPPGKPDLLEGATKDEVLAAWTSRDSDWTREGS